MINKILWSCLYLFFCVTFFNNLNYSLIANMVISIGITTAFLFMVYSFNKHTEKAENGLDDFYAMLLLINIVGPLISSTEDLSLERPFLILGFYYGLYLIIRYSRREGFKLLAIIPAVILSSILFCLAQKWIYIPFIYISALMGWWSYSNKTKS